jgi:CheY-like chemotaxis protein
MLRRMTTPLRIWLVDDDLDEQMLVRLVMGQLPAPVELYVMDDPTKAIRVLEEATPDKLPHLIICDVKMRQMSGFEFVEWLRKSRWKAMPIVMCSNSQHNEDVTRAYALGANAFHVKSPTLDGMRSCFVALTDYWGTTMSLPRLN